MLLSHSSACKMAGKKRSLSLGADVCDVRKEWDEALCPICMEHPHNAVLLLCSSHAKGCRSYICDTSYRHSNCLDRFRKLKTDCTSPEPTPPTNLGISTDDSSPPLQSTSMLGREFPELRRAHIRSERNLPARRFRDSAIGRQYSESSRDRSETTTKLSLKCPLCRGDVLGWTVVEEARKHLDLKARSCTRESCSFVGNYCELRRHARDVHPRVRPAEVDPSRQRAWRRFEHERDHDDIVSAIRSAMPGAIVLGDYVIEGPTERERERERTSGVGDHASGSGSGSGSGPWWTTFFFFQMLESMQSLAGGRPRRSRPGPWTRHRRSFGGGSSRQQQRYLWGENLLGLQDDDDDDGDEVGDDSFTDDDDDDELNMFVDNDGERERLPGSRQRRRLNQFRSSRDRQ